MAGLVKSGDYDRAYRTWARFAGLPGQPGPKLFNPDFARSSAPPPFNWQLLNGAAGVAEPAVGGGLNVLYYGREEAVLASQLLLLKPGHHRLIFSTQGAGPALGQLSWALVCLPGANRIGNEALAAGAATFSIPVSKCSAQELQLRGEPTDAPMTMSVRLSNLRLTGGEGQ